MKKLQLLKALLDLFWFFSVIAIIGLVTFAGYLLISNRPIGIPLTINGQHFSVDSMASKVVLIFGCIAYGFFAFGIYQLRAVLKLFSAKMIFEQDTIRLLNNVGKNFLISSLIVCITLFFYNAFEKSTVYLDFGGGFSSFLFSASLGLFFMVLSEVFAIAKAMKDENDLTV